MPPIAALGWSEGEGEGGAFFCRAPGEAETEVSEGVGVFWDAEGGG